MALDWTGERFIPGVGASIAYEHLGRYYFVKRYCHGKLVLDVPSGEGYGTQLLSGVAKKVVGVDISEASVTHASERYHSSNLEFKVGDLAHLPFESNTFDIVTCFEGIEHIPQNIQTKALIELRRVLKTDGTLFISTPNKKTYSDIPGYKNEFHTHEFYTAEFYEFLKAEFPEVTFFGQTIMEGSTLRQLEIDEKMGDKASNDWLAEALTLSKSQHGCGELSRNPDHYVYLVAACSAHSQQWPTGYFLADFDQSLQIELKTEIEKWVAKAVEQSALVEVKGKEHKDLIKMVHALQAELQALKQRLPVRIALRAIAPLDQNPKIKKAIWGVLKPLISKLGRR